VCDECMMSVCEYVKVRRVCDEHLFAESFLI